MVFKLGIEAGVHCQSQPRLWLGQSAIQRAYIRPGSPWEQAYIESFHDKLRDECLNREILPTLAEAQVILEGWRIEYNQQRRHIALGYLTLAEFSRRQTTTGCDRQ
jgi:putative transposase